MPYVDLAGLSRFAGKSKDFASSACAGLDMANWQRTAAAGAVSFSPVPEMPLDPAVNFAFTETGPASGTKGPDNPSTITGVSSVKVTRCGKNIFRCKNAITQESNGLTFVVAANGICTLSGTATANTFFYITGSNFPYPVTKAGQIYTLSGCPAGGSQSTYCLAGAANHDGSVVYMTDYGSGYTFSKAYDARWQIYVYVASGTAISTPLTFKPQLELGTTATPFEPYEGADYAIPLGDTYYGGSVDLSAGTMTVTWWSDVLSDPTTVEVLSSYVRATYATSKGTMGSGSAPTYFRSNYDDDGSFVYPRFGAGTARCSIAMSFARLGFDSTPTVEEATAAMASFLETHPCVVVYKLYTPLTVQLTPTQLYSLSQVDPYTPRINTVYSDQTSVQVGYPKSPQATQNELTSIRAKALLLNRYTKERAAKTINEL